MKHFEYVTKKEYGPIKEELIDLIRMVQDDVREHFTFRYDFIGSASRNMITREVGGNVGYDFDVFIRAEIFRNVKSRSRTVKENDVSVFDEFYRLKRYLLFFKTVLMSSERKRREKTALVGYFRSAVGSDYKPLGLKIV